MSIQMIIDNKYITEECEGEGATSKVFRVKDLKDKDKIYAAKIFFVNTSCFNDEKEILTLLKDKGSKNIINIIYGGIGEMKVGKASKQKQYLILDYAEKKDLSRYLHLANLSNKGFTESFAQLLFYKIYEAVKEIHVNQVCHRDLKTENILLDSKFNPKICDFGFSTLITDKEIKICGSKYYVAPEVLLSKEKKFKFDGAPVDFFALGVILFNLISGKHSFNKPIKNDDSYKYIISRDYAKFWEKQSLNITPSNEFKELFVKMIDPDPKQRPNIDTIEDYKWIKDFKEKSQKEKEDLEIGLYQEFLKREKKIKESTKKTIKTETINNCNGEDNRGSSDEDGLFDCNNEIRSFKEGEYMEFSIIIEGNLKQIKFMNDLYLKIEKEYENDKEYECTIDCSKDKLKFKATFTFIEKEDIKEETETEKKNENNEINEENEKNDCFKKKECIIDVELFKYKNGFLLRFLRKSGELEDFYENLKIIYSYAEELL